MVDTVSKMNVVSAPLSALKPYANNPRTHSARQIRQIAESLKRFGWTNPLLVDAEGGIIAGHGRVAAAARLGMTEVPTIRLDHMSEAEKRAYIIADNKLAENAGWDDDLLAIELQFLIEADLDFEVEITGFDTAEIDQLLSFDESDADEEEVELSAPGAPVVSRPGDLWQIGRHRLLCGDALDPANWDRLVAGEAAQMAFTDPPYNVPIAGHVSGLGKTQHREFAMATGEMDSAGFATFLRSVFENLAAVSIDGAIHFHCMDWRHMGEMLAAGEAVYSELKNLCVWAKTNAGMGSFYRSQHELVFAYKLGKGAHINTFGLGEHGRHRSNLWTYPGVNTFRSGRMEDLAAHPTVKPQAMVADAILDCSKRGGLILDAFAGSGTTLLAAEHTGRRGAAMELDPSYVDLTVRRLEKAVGEPATNDDGIPFANIATARVEEAA